MADPAVAHCDDDFMSNQIMRVDGGFLKTVEFHAIGYDSAAILPHWAMYKTVVDQSKCCSH